MARVVRMGVDETIRDLEALGREIIPKVGRPALRVGGQAAVQIAKATAARRTGELAESIQMVGPDGEVWNPDGSAGSETLEPPDGETQTSTAVAVGSPLWRAHYIEFGVPHAPAQPDVGNAVEQVDQVIQDALDHYMDELLTSRGF